MVGRFELVAEDLPLHQRRFVRALDVLNEHGVIEKRYVAAMGATYYGAGEAALDKVLAS